MTAGPASLPAVAPVRAAPSRNLFQYADERPPDVPTPAILAPPPPLQEPHAAPDPVPAVRLVGLIRRSGHLAAALMVQGEMTVAREGERAGGYTVLTVDDEAGVRLRGPDGAEILLPPPSF
jgi:hypothetical protein